MAKHISQLVALDNPLLQEVSQDDICYKYDKIRWDDYGDICIYDVEIEPIDNKIRKEIHIRGDVAESLAKTYLLQQGYLVFQNVSQHGQIDLIAVDEEGNKRMIDVKVICFRKRDSRIIKKCKTPIQKRLGVELMYVDPVKGWIFFE